MEFMLNKKKSIIIAAVIVVAIIAALVAYSYWPRKKKGVVTIDGLKMVSTYKVGSDKRSGDPRIEEDYEQYYVNTIINALGTTREEFDMLNPTFANSMWIGKGITINY